MLHRKCQEEKEQNSLLHSALKKPLEYSLISKTILFTEITQLPSSGEKCSSIVQCLGGKECLLRAQQSLSMKC